MKVLRSEDLLHKHHYLSPEQISLKKTEVPTKKFLTKMLQKRQELLTPTLFKQNIITRECASKLKDVYSDTNDADEFINELFENFLSSDSDCNVRIERLVEYIGMSCSHYKENFKQVVARVKDIKGKYSYQGKKKISLHARNVKSFPFIIKTSTIKRRNKACHQK